MIIVMITCMSVSVYYHEYIQADSLYLIDCWDSLADGFYRTILYGKLSFKLL